MADLEIFRNVPAKYVAEFHRQSDADKDTKSLHHSLGNAPYQAAYGNHIHDGRLGRALFDGTVIAGSRSTAVSSILQQIITLLVQVGAQDGTSA